MDWKALIPLIVTALAPAIGSFLFSMWQKASTSIQKLPDIVKQILYVAMSALIAMLSNVADTVLPGNLDQFTADTWQSVVLAIFYAYVYRKGSAGATTPSTASVRK